MSKVENPRQITKFQTGKSLLEFNDRLSPADVCCASNLHASFSKINMVAMDYSKGTGDNTIIADHNVDPDVFKAVAEGILYGDLKEYSEHKNISSRTNDKGECKVSKLNIVFKDKDENGNVMRYPWTVSIENGWGFPESTPIGGITLQKNSYRKEKFVQLRIDDLGFRIRLIAVRDYILAFENYTMSWILGERKMYEESKNSST